jgi:ribosomal protein S18 acetylase RimI-like enzyme
MAFAVRRLGTDDVDQFRRIRLEALANVPEAFGSSYNETVLRSTDYFTALLTNNAVFGAEQPDGTLAGIVGFHRLEGEKLDHRGEVFSMYVAEDLRGTGCAQALIEAVVAHASPLVRQLHLGVGTFNDRARKLYEKMGFETYATEPRAMRVGDRYIDEYVMVRFLDEAPGKKQDNE